MDIIKSKAALIIASGSFLGETLPANFDDWDDEKLESFLVDNTWHSLENTPIKEVWYAIEALAAEFIEVSTATANGDYS